jgi:hypothetical protein
VLRFGAAGIFAEGDVADPVEAIFDAPMAPIEGEQIGCGRSLGCEARDRVGNLRRHASLLFDDTFDAADLLEPRPSEELGQPRTGLQMPLGEAAMAFVLRATFRQLCLTFAFTIGGKIPAEIRLRSPPSARVGCLSQRSSNRHRRR